ncbi:hypothetical protein [Actinomycetospora soli]|uniref:hypothetical protein n=1 Tax=Actinomycetospora soli TaxID=2893887 RepID=UPI001E6548AA|nr:hypothetical protein [Actinomycetospora soli]MCD2190015.1 hypothetical protein [Actinomycetospora soli]
MTREQEITTMGAHAARPSEHDQHRPSTVARLAATTLTVAVTGALGAGTALAHDGAGHDGGHGGHGDHGGHTERTVDGWSGDEDDARAEAERAGDRARETVRDVLADLGLPGDSGDFADSGDHAASGDADGGDESDAAATADESHDSHDSHDTEGHPAPAAGSPQPNRPSSGGTTTQPIATNTADRPTSDVPPAGQTQTFPIR